MLDKLGYVCEVDGIDSLSGISGKSDRANEDQHNFWNILASEMNEAEKSPVNRENSQTPESASRDKPNAAGQEKMSSSVSDTQKGNPHAESPADQNASERSQEAVNGEATAQDPNDEKTLSPAEISHEVAGHPSPSGQTIVCRQEAEQSHLAAIVTDTQGKHSDQEEPPEETPTGQPTVEILGLGMTSVPVTSQVITFVVDNGTDTDEPGLISEKSERQLRKKSDSIGIQRDGTNAKSLPFGAADGKPSNETIIDSQEVTGEAAIIPEWSALPEANREGSVHPRTVTSNRPQPKKETGPIQGGASDSVPNVNRGQDVFDTRTHVIDGANPTNLTREIVDNGGDNMLKAPQVPKQDSDVILQRTHSGETEQLRADQSAEATPTRRMSALTEHTEHLITIQRVAQAIRLAHERHGEIRLRLYPPELGALKLQMRVQEGVLTARLEVETAAARDLLLDNLPGLRERLTDHHIRVENFDVALMNDSLGGQANGWDDSASSPQAFKHRGTSPAVGGSDGHAETPKTVTLRRTENGQFDVIV